MPKPTKVAARSTKDIDVLIGKRIREGRIEKGLSQAAIGEAVGVSLQQMQKYERVANRISASTLYGICHFLNYPIRKLFEPANAKKRHQP
jgi:transcriptional regulator with XRE-family HTH domain